MSHWETTQVAPTPATQQEVNNQIERLRRLLQAQIREAQRAAGEQATERARKIQEEQIRRIKESIRALDESTRRNLDAMDQRHRQQLQEITQRVYEDIAQSQRKMQERINSQLEDMAADFTGQIEDLDTRIQRQRQQDIQTINHQMEIIVNDINDMAQSIDDRFKENESQIANIQDDLADIRKRFQDEDELARQTVAAAKALLDVVEKRTMLDRFIPQEAQNVRLTMQWLMENQNHGAALTAAAGQAINAIRLAEIHALQEKAKHDALVEVAMTQVEKVLAVVNENREVEREVKGGKPMKVECDFWSEGEYGRLEKELNDLKAELEDRYNGKLTEERIKAILTRSAVIEGRIMQISAESVAKAILSEERVETVEDIINAMGEKGWMLKGLKEGKPENAYMGGEEDHDWRKGVFAVLENNLGEEITIIVDPVTLNQNQLIVHQETSGKSEQEVQQQMEAIKQQLCEIGYPIGETTSGVAQIPEMGSAESLGKAHATEKIRGKVQ